MEEGGEVGMTNQEAAEMIRNDMKLHHDYLSGQYRKALNMAINALLKEQEAQRDYEASVEMAEYCERYEHTYSPEDVSM